MKQLSPLQRALLHFPVGVFAAFLTHWETAIGAVFAVSFLVYEVIEDWRIHDKSYLDIYGYLFGLGVAGAVIAILGRLP